MLCSPTANAARKDRAKEASAPYALVAGTVYRPPGFSLPGAKVTVSPEQPETSGVKLKKIQAFSDARGEWAVRVPPVPAKWRVDVKIDGYLPAQRTVSVKGEQRVDLSIVLDPALPAKEAAK